MWPFTKKKIENFNVIIEGTFPDEWKNLNYKLAHIDIPEGTAVLNDGTYKYTLYGKTDDFKNIQRVQPGNLEVKIDPLSLCKGIVLSEREGIKNNPLLDRPRTVCTRDGRVYIDKDMTTEKSYIKDVPFIVENAGEVFGKPEASEMYKKLIRL